MSAGMQHHVRAIQRNSIARRIGRARGAWHEREHRARRDDLPAGVACVAGTRAGVRGTDAGGRFVPRAGDGERTVPDPWRGEHRAQDGGGAGADGRREDDAWAVRGERGAEAVGLAFCPDAGHADPADGRGDDIAGVFAGRGGGAVGLGAGGVAGAEASVPGGVRGAAGGGRAPQCSGAARLGLGRRARAARARLGAGGGVVDGAAAALHGRTTERLATRAETASQAPWRAAIAAARALRQAMDGARGQVRGANNDAMGGAAAVTGGQTRGVRKDPMGGTGGCPAPNRRNDPIGGRQAPDAGCEQRPYGRHGGLPSAGRAQRPYGRHRAPDAVCEQRPYGRHGGLPNAGRAQRPYRRRGGGDGGRSPGRAQRPYRRHELEPVSGCEQRPYRRRGGGDRGPNTERAQRPYGRHEWEPDSGCEQRPYRRRGGGAAGTGGQTRGVRNDPTGGSAVRIRAAGALLGARVGVLAERRAGETIEWVPGSHGMWEALAREVEKRRLRAAAGLRGNDPIGGIALAVGGAADGARIAPAVTGSGSTRGPARGGTTLARTWEPGVAEVLAARFGPAAEEGWARVPVAPPGIAAMPSGGCAQ